MWANTKYFFLLADEKSGNGHAEQLRLSVFFSTKTRCFLPLTSTIGKAVADSLLYKVVTLHSNVLRGQGHDRASNMSVAYWGVQVEAGP